MAHPVYGARYCRGASSEAVAATTIVYFIAPLKLIYIYFFILINKQTYDI